MKYSILFKSCVLKSLLAPEEYGNHVFFLPGWGWGGGGGGTFVTSPLLLGQQSCSKMSQLLKGLGANSLTVYPH